MDNWIKTEWIRKWLNEQMDECNHNNSMDEQPNAWTDKEMEKEKLIN